MVRDKNDKIYLLDKLYSYMELIDRGLDFIESSDKDLGSKVMQSKRTLTDMKEQLEDLRKNILATKIIDKQYGLFIKGPRGYDF